MIPALLIGREGSIGFPGKNIYSILGRPMMVYPLLAALNSKYVDKVYISTDSKKIKELGRNMGAEMIERPAELCTNEALGEEVFVHGYNYIKANCKEKIELVILLFCNAPTIVSERLDEGIEVLRENPDYDSGATVSQYNMWSPIRARRINKDGLLEPFIPFENYSKDIRINCDRDAQGDVFFADCSGYVVRPRCLEDLSSGILPQRWMGRKIFPIKQWGGCDVDYKWQVPSVEYWLREHGFSERATPYTKRMKIRPKSTLDSVYRTPRIHISRYGKMRLDKNENTIGFDKDIMSELLSKIDSEAISAYPDFTALYSKLAKWVGCSEEQIIVTNGSDGGIKSAFEAFIQAGDRVLTLEPTYAMYDVYCRMFGAERILVELDSSFSPSLDSIFVNIERGLDLIAIANPNSPTGTIIEEERLLEIITRAHGKGTLALIDEAYYGFYPKTLVPLIDKFDNLMIVRTFSKSAGLASLRIGFVISNKEIIKNLYKVKPMYETNGIAARFAEYMLDNLYLIERYITQVSEGKEYLSDGLEDLGFKVHRGFANFILVSVPNGREEIVSALCKEGMLVNSGFSSSFLKDYIRITVGPKSQMETFMLIFKKCLAEIRQEC